MRDAHVDESPSRIVLAGVPKVRYFKDGMCPFALSLKCLTDYLGQNHSYRYILGTSGACFRMSWNHQQWDEGNMDLGRLGPGPFRHGLRSVGPPEVSIVCGYDDGGEVLIGWAAMDGEYPKDQREPNGMFRQGDWFARTQGGILIEGKPEPPDLERVYTEALAWAYEVSTLPKNKTHVFGQEAYKQWGWAMAKDHAFPDDDEETLQKRRHTVWDGMIMMAERGDAATFLEEIAESRPKLAEHLREAARLFREDGEWCGRMQKPLGGHQLFTPGFADPTARRSAVDMILAAGEKNAEAARHLALVAANRSRLERQLKRLKGLRARTQPVTPLRPWHRVAGAPGWFAAVDRAVKALERLLASRHLSR